MRKGALLEDELDADQIDHDEDSEQRGEEVEVPARVASEADKCAKSVWILSRS